MYVVEVCTVCIALTVVYYLENVFTGGARIYSFCSTVSIERYVDMPHIIVALSSISTWRRPDETEISIAGAGSKRDFGRVKYVKRRKKTEVK